MQKVLRENEQLESQAEKLPRALNSLKFDGQVLTNPEAAYDRAVTHYLSTLPADFEKVATQSAPQEVIEMYQRLEEGLRMIAFIPHASGDLHPAKVLIRLAFNSELAALWANRSEVVFMGVDAVIHAQGINERIADFENRGLRLGARYRVAEVPPRDSDGKFAIYTDRNEVFYTDFSYFGRER
jgi:hypothetical protein